MATAAQQKALTIRDYIHQSHVVKQLEAALPSFLTAERFLRTFYTAMLRNPKLFDCTKESLLSAMIEAAQLGLEPILGKAALIPFKNKSGVLEVQFQPMYRGLIDLARRTAEVKVTAHVVYSKDDFEIEYGDNEKCYHKPYLQGDRGEKIGAYTVWTFASGAQSFLFLPMADILEVRDKYSKSWKQSGKDSVWGKSEAEMSKKTVIKNHSKLQPCSIEVERAVELDHRVEIGETQRDLLGQFDYPAGKPAKEHEDEEPAQHLIDKFDVKVSEKENVNLEKLSQYLALCASSQQGATVNDVKASAIRKGFDSFWGFYTDWLKSQKVEPEGEKEDPIRKLYKGLGDPKFQEFVSSHASAIPNMEKVYRDEIEASWGTRAKKKGGLLEGKPYPLDVPKAGPPVADEEPNPIMLNCMLSYEDRPEKREEDGKMATTQCDALKCDSREICVPYRKDKENSKT